MLIDYNLKEQQYVVEMDRKEFHRIIGQYMTETKEGTDCLKKAIISWVTASDISLPEEFKVIIKDPEVI